MELAGGGERLEALCVHIRDRIAHYAGRVEYGNLRSHISEFSCGDGDPVTNVALVYETPGGSTDQINIEFNHVTGHFAIIDAEEGEIRTESIEDVMERITPRIVGIPQKRLETLHDEIRRNIDDGANHAGLFGHLNRILQSEFKGGGITHIELRDAMTFAVHYMKARGAS
jgi:hypothetical protein